MFRHSMRRAVANISSLTLSLHDYSSLESTATSSFTLPSNQAGDLLVFVAQVDSLSNITTPTGWTLAASSANGTIRKTNLIWYKIAQSGDTTVGTDWQFIDAFCLCFRPNSTVYSFQHYDGASETTTGNPAAQVVESGSSNGIATLVVGAAFEAGTTDPAFSTFSPSPDETITAGIDCSIAYKIYNEGDTPVNHTVDMNDLGNEMSLCSVYFEISNIPSYNYETDFGTPTYTITTFPSQAAGVNNGANDVLIAIDANISSTDDGVLMEAGGTAAGLSIGVSNGTLRVRGYDGSTAWTSIVDANTAYLEIDISSYTGTFCTYYFAFDTSNSRQLKAYVQVGGKGSVNQLVSLGTNSAASSGNPAYGGGAKGYGTIGTDGAMPDLESAYEVNFNGTIDEIRYWAENAALDVSTFGT